MKLGIPRALYYYLEPKWMYFFEYLNIETIISEETNFNILKRGTDIINDEACLSLKIFIGHVDYLKDKCDYLFLPQIDNFGLYNQGCANYIALYEIVKNQFDLNILDCNINKNEFNAFLTIGKKLNKTIKEIKKAYMYCNIKNQKDIKKNHQISMNKLKSDKKKILIVSHSYNINDKLIGGNVIKYLIDNDCEVIKSSDIDPNFSYKLDNMCPKLYFKYSKENIRTLEFLKDKIDGVIFLTVFPCGLDALVNELAIRKIKIPYLNLIIDDINSMVGIETRLESFIDIVGVLNV